MNATTAGAISMRTGYAAFKRILPGAETSLFGLDKYVFDRCLFGQALINIKIVF